MLAKTQQGNSILVQKYKIMELKEHRYFMETIQRAKDDRRLTSFDLEVLEAIACLLAENYRVEYGLIHSELTGQGFDRYSLRRSIDRLFNFSYLQEKLSYVEGETKGYIVYLQNPFTLNKTLTYTQKRFKSLPLKELFAI